MNLQTYVHDRALAAKRASDAVAHLSTESKHRFFDALKTLLSGRQAEILAENAKDLEQGRKKGLSAAMLDRLALTEGRLREIAVAIDEVKALPDPVGKVVSAWERPNGLHVSRVRIPLGVIAMIYESRPNVTIDAAILCFKAGNAVILRGGSEAIHSNIALAKLLKEASAQVGLSPEWVQLIEITDRETIPILVQQVGLVDLVIPRGGEGLMRFIDAHARVPVVKHDKGVCSLYIDEAADRDMAIAIAVNAKAERPGVCNAVENIWVHGKLAADFVPTLVAALEAKGVRVKGDDGVRRAVPHVEAATPEDWTTEYLDLVVSVGLVHDVDDAIARIRETSSLHTEAIVTEDGDRALRFLNALNSSCVLWNASTRFNDGGQLGLGAEIGISTTKLHAFGPMGLEELTATKFVVKGKGQVRS